MLDASQDTNEHTVGMLVWQAMDINSAVTCIIMYTVEHRSDANSLVCVHSGFIFSLWEEFR